MDQSLSREVGGIIQQAVPQDGGLLGSKDECWAETEGVTTASHQVNAGAEEVFLHALCNLGARHVETDEGTVPSDVREDATLSLYAHQLNLKEGAGVANVAEEVLLLDGLPCDTEVQELDHVNILLKSEAVKVAVSDLVESAIDSGVEATDAGLASECNDICGCAQVPVLVCPHLAGCADTGLGLIDHKDDLVILDDLSKSLVEIWSGHFVLKGRDWLDDNRCNILLLIPICDDGIPDLLKASILLGFVFVFKLSMGYLILGKEARGQSKVGTSYTLTLSSLHESVLTELPWYPCSNPKTQRFETSLIPWRSAYLSRATVSADSFACVVVPSFRCTWVIPWGAIGMTTFLRRSA